MGAGRYEPIELLLDEGGVTTTLCLDLLDGGQVVVKRVDGQLLPQRDWDRVQQAVSPILSGRGSAESPVIDACFDRASEMFSIVSRFVPGQSLAARIAEHGALGLEEVLSVGRHIALALARHHAAGIVHCAVSPGNIVVAGAGEAQLIDIGLARTAALAGAFHERLAHRAAYVAPELAGLIELDVDVQVDFYSLGIVLFEALSGASPFPTMDPSAVWRDHATAEPPSLRGTGIAVPRALDDLVLGLLSKDPRDRGDSAVSLANQISAIIEALRRGVPEPGRSPTTPSTTDVQCPAFVGRMGDLALLGRSMRSAQRGESSLVVIEGESGIGKSRLIDAFCDEAAATGGWVLRGRAEDRGTPQPLQLLSGVVEDIASAMRRSHDLASQVLQRLGRDAPLLAMAVPQLASAFRTAGTDGASPGHDQPHQVVHALANLLGALGSPEHPAIIVLDDCQWGDDISLEVVRLWEQMAQRSGRCVIVIAAIRTEGFPRDHLLRQGNATCIALKPLSRTQIGKMLATMADGLPSETVDVISAHARGNPFMASALLWGLVESGALARANGDWCFQPRLVPIQVSRGAGVFLSTRLDFLSPRTRSVLSVAAVVGRAFDVELVAAIAGLDVKAIRECLTDAEHRHLVLRLDDSRFGFSHDRVRELLVGELDAEEKSRLHNAAASAIEAADPTRVFELSFHYDAAARRDRALPYALAAARLARERFDLGLAERHLRIAERNTNEASEFDVLEEVGALLILRGDYDAASDRLVRARELAPDALTAARIEGRLGDAAFKRGDGEGCEAHLLTALSLLGRPVQADGDHYAWLLLREQGARAARRIASSLRPRRVRTDGPAILEAELLTRLAYAWWFNRRTLPALWLLTRQVNVAEAQSSGVAQAHAKAIYGAAITAVVPALARRGLRYTDDAGRLHLDAGSRWGQGQALSMQAAVLHARGSFQDALDAATQAEEILEQSGDRWELSFVMWHRALCLYRLGRFDEATVVARVVHQAGVELQAAQAEAIGLEILAKIDTTTISAEVVTESLEHAGSDAHATASAAQAKACRLRSLGRHQEALELLSGSYSRLHPPRHMNVYVAPLVSWLATLERERAESADDGSRSERRAVVRKARRAARRALRSSWLYRPEAPRAYREAALVAGLTGSTRRARRLLRRSASIARGQGARVELSLTQAAADRYSMPALTAQDHLTPSENEVAARDAAGPARNQPTLGLIDQFDAMLEAGSVLASAGSQVDLAQAIAEACHQLLRAERCAVAPVDGSGAEATDEIEGASFPDGRDLVRRAISRRHPVRLARAGVEPAALGGRAIGGHVRSALCAPILIEDQVVGWFTVASTQIDDFFGADDERLAQFISRMAGAALAREHLRQELRAGIIGAQEAERARIARDLHDELGQALTSILLGLRATQTAVAAGVADASTVSARLDRLRADTDDAVASLHRLAFELRPLVLDDLGFAAALRRLVAGIQERYDLQIEVAGGDGPGEERLPPDVETTAYRVTQEALTNILRHASAESASILMAVARGRVRVVIEDDGMGFDTTTPMGRGLGLRSMSERAALVGGTVRVTSAPGAGTAVILEIPIG